MALEHGGRLRAAAHRYGIPLADWVDLSTGISPWSWPVPAVPDAVWRRLPEDEDGLVEAARKWARLPDQAGCLPVPGTQAVIQHLPRLRPNSRVGVPHPGYAEHAHRWAAAGHQLVQLSDRPTDAAVDQLDVLVWIHPNNPTGQVLPADRLLEWHRRLAAKGGWLVLDEAFVEAADCQSLASRTGPDGLVVLRSLGKFFGLAGLRGGIMAGPATLCQALDEAIGPWALTGPGRWLMRQALADREWQRQQERRLAVASKSLETVLRASGLGPTTGTRLFRYAPHPDAAAIAEHLAQRGILVRQFENPAALRFGLPGDSTAQGRLESALADCPAALSTVIDGSVPRH